jgi:transposase-like protein
VNGQVANRPIYTALGVSADGGRGILGPCAAEYRDGEGAHYWLRMLAEIKNRATKDLRSALVGSAGQVRVVMLAAGKPEDSVRLQVQHIMDSVLDMGRGAWQARCGNDLLV